MKKKNMVSILLALLLLAGGCVSAEEEGAVAPAAGAVAVDASELFSDRDFRTDYDSSACAYIQLNGNSASCSSDAVKISGSTVTILDEGTYVLSGTLDDGMVIVNAEKTDKTQLVLAGVSIHSATSAPLYILQADKVFVTLAENSENQLSNGGSFVAIDENNIDAVLFSKEDITLNGQGSLTILSPAGHGIVSKDELTVTGGHYTIEAANHGMNGKDNVCIAGGNFAIASGKDGIHAEHDEDAALGFAYISGGSFEIAAQGDGISASADMTIEDGQFSIVTGSGSENAQMKTQSGFGRFQGNLSSADTSDSVSTKGIKASGNLAIRGGTFSVNAEDDAIHANGAIYVYGGQFDIATGDDGFHADDLLQITAGSIAISRSYEGLEGLCVEVSGGAIDLTASDDGINAAGGTDQSGFGGPWGKDMFASDSDCYITISGGELHIYASGDGVDSNGTLEVSGGYTIISGPVGGDTASLDYGSSGYITGGTLMATGASQMFAGFDANSTQGAIMVGMNTQTAGTEITLLDGNGNILLTHEAKADFNCVILSSPDITLGETYNLQVGSISGEVTASVAGTRGGNGPSRGGGGQGPGGGRRP